MGIRFRKSIKISKGVRLNVSKRGISTTIGKRGLSATFGKRGTSINAGIPGSGISYHTNISNKLGKTKSSTKQNRYSLPDESQEISAKKLIITLMIIASCLAAIYIINYPIFGVIVIVACISIAIFEILQQRKIFKLNDYEDKIANANSIIELSERIDKDIIDKRRKLQELENIYVEKEKELEIEYEKKRLKKIEQYKNQGKAILQLSDDMTLIKKYDTIAAASKETGIDRKCIRDTALGNQKHAGGFVWKYANEINTEEKSFDKM